MASLHISITIDIDANLETVWAALTTAHQIRQWWDEGVSLEARLGGQFEERWTDSDGRTVVTRGRVERFEPPNAFDLSWADEDWAVETEVGFRLAQAGSGTRLVLKHRGWQQFGDEDGRRLAEAHEAGWRRHLEALRTFAATGRRNGT